MRTCPQDPVGRRPRAFGAKSAFIRGVRNHLLLVLFALLLPQELGYSSRFVTPEQVLFGEESEKLLEKKRTEFTLGLHGEFIFPAAGRIEKLAYVISRDDGTYDIAVFDFPNRYFFGRISADLTIQYDLSKLPPAIPVEKFCGPKVWPFSDSEKKALFPRPDAVSIFADYPGKPTEESATENLVGYGYPCLSEYTLLVSDRMKHSPHALPLLRDGSGNMNLVPSEQNPTPLLTIVNGGWDRSVIRFMTSNSGQPLSKERCQEWPFHDDRGNPSISPHVFLSPLRGAVTKVWTQYDKNGRAVGVVSAPVS